MATIAALYCHLPFCHTICPFCAFAVHGNVARLHRPYLDAVKHEIALAATAHAVPSDGVRSLYFGGGTPSALPLPLVEELLDWLGRHFPLAPDAEVAFEVNPEDAAPEYLAGLVALGVTRVSLGVQSLDGATLRALRRNHDPAGSWRAIETALRRGPGNLNVDLMFGAPGIGETAFREDVVTVAAHGPPHLSLYGLDLEPGTLFARDPEIVAWAEARREAQAGQYLWAARYLREKGYRHYEVSNFCLPGREGRQNLLVWEGEPYLGFGTGAHSYVDGARHHNHRHMRPYLRDIDAGRLPIANREQLTAVQRANERLMLALRQERGLDVAAWEAECGVNWDRPRAACAEQLAAGGKARWDGATLALTAEGFAVADAVTAQLMVE